MGKKLFNNKVQLPNGLPSGNEVKEVAKSEKEVTEVAKSMTEVTEIYEKTIKEYEHRLKKILNEIELVEMNGFFGKVADLDALYTLYTKSGNSRGGLDSAEFKEFVSAINAFNSLIGGETTFIYMDGERVQLSEIPFDIRLKALLMPKAVTIDVYDKRMHDFKLVDANIKCNVSLERWKYLQSNFFYNWKNRMVDESISIDNVMENATLSQISKRCFVGENTSESESNYYRADLGDVYSMPVRVSIRLWDKLSDAMSYNDALFEVYHGLFLRILKN